MLSHTCHLNPSLVTCTYSRHVCDMSLVIYSRISRHLSCCPLVTCRSSSMSTSASTFSRDGPSLLSSRPSSPPFTVSRCRKDASYPWKGVFHRSGGDTVINIDTSPAPPSPRYIQTLMDDCPFPTIERPRVMIDVSGCYLMKPCITCAYVAG